MVSAKTVLRIQRAENKRMTKKQIRIRGQDVTLKRFKEKAKAQYPYHIIKRTRVIRKAGGLSAINESPNGIYEVVMVRWHR